MVKPRSFAREPALTVPQPREETPLRIQGEMDAAGLPDGVDAAALSIREIGRLLTQGRLRFLLGRHDLAAETGLIPLLGFALELRALLHDLRPEDHARLPLDTNGAGLHFIRISDTVRIAGGKDGRSGMVLYPDAAQVARGFLGSVSRELLSRHPELLANEELASLTVGSR